MLWPRFSVAKPLSTRPLCTAACARGQGLRQGNCSACPQGFYSAGGNATVPQPTCTPCPIGRTTRTNGSTVIGNCTEVMCEWGQGALPNGTCANCPVGTYSPGGFTWDPKPVCTSCNANFTTQYPRSTRATDCSLRICPPGTYWAGPTNGCLDCALNTWSAGGTILAPQPTSCTPCPGNRVTRTTRSTSAAACLDRESQAGPGPGWARMDRACAQQTVHENQRCNHPE